MRVESLPRRRRHDGAARIRARSSGRGRPGIRVRMGPLPGRSQLARAHAPASFGKKDPIIPNGLGATVPARARLAHVSTLVSAPPCSSRRPAARPFFRDDRAAGEDLAAPDPVRFTSFGRASEADPPHRAGLAVCLGELQVGRQVREPQLRILASAGQRLIQCRCLRRQQDQGAGHELLPPAGRSAVALGLLDLFHVRPPFH